MNSGPSALSTWFATTPESGALLSVRESDSESDRPPAKTVDIDRIDGAYRGEARPDSSERPRKPP